MLNPSLLQKHALAVLGVAAACCHMAGLTNAADSKGAAPASGQFVATRSKVVLQTAADSFAFSPDSSKLVTGGGQVMKVWDVATGKQLQSFMGHGDDILAVAVSPSGQTVASGYRDDTVRLWDSKTGRRLHTLVGQDQRITSVAFSPDGRILASGEGFIQSGRPGDVRLWDVETGTLLRTLTGHRQCVRDVAFSPDGKLVASASQYDSVKLWEVQTGKLLRTMEGDSLSVAFSPDGKTLVSGGWTGDEGAYWKLWETATGKLKRTIKENSNGVHSVAFSPDGKWFAGVSENFVKVWDAHSGKLIGKIPGDVKMAFSPDGKLLATKVPNQLSSKGTIQIWHLR